MLFNSLDFAIFLPIVFVLYWSIGKGSAVRQNVILLLASYFFYGWWDWRFLGLIFLSSCVDYLVGAKMGTILEKEKRKPWLWVSLICNIGLLGYFKYFNFFVDSFVESVNFFGGSMSYSTMNIILPVGISFYTFQTLSYSIDIYRGTLKPEPKFLNFLVFVSFFPQLVAGPIERAKDFLPQIKKSRSFNYVIAKSGMQLCLWGLFKKLLIADKAKVHIDLVEQDFASYHQFGLILYILLIAIQVYCDFSGYSDIAVGIAKIFRVNLSNNFNSPFFSTGFQDFWKRWHKTLYSWFFDYLGSLFKGFSRRKLAFKVLAIFIISGLWHGAEMHYVIWGGVCGILFLPRIYGFKLVSNKEKKIIGKFKKAFYGASVFGMFALAGLFYQLTVAEINVFFDSIFSLQTEKILFLPSLYLLCAFLGLYFLEFKYMDAEYPFLEFLNQAPRFVRSFSYCTVIILILLFTGESPEFVYFNF